MSVTETNISCGINQFEGLTDDPVANLIRMGNELAYKPCAFIIWSDVWGRNKNGNRLYHYIRRNFPRSYVTRTKTAKNPNSGNIICLYSWKIPQNFINKWLPENSDLGECSSNKYKEDWCEFHKCYPEDCY